jgi:hypothetical protein
LNGSRGALAGHGILPELFSKGAARLNKRLLVYFRVPAVAVLAAVWGMVADAGVAAQPHVISSVNLSAPFGSNTPWRFIASQAPDMPDPIGQMEKVPGVISLCMTRDEGKTCLPGPEQALQLPADKRPKDDLFAEPHELRDARIVYAQADLPLFLLEVASTFAVNSNQRVATQMYAYNRAHDSFGLVYAHQTGRNNNEEVRFIGKGPLQGHIISAEPTQNAPFGYWITVSSMASGSSYKQVLHYRSATLYGDGNPLAVIDAEMPNIMQRMGLWKPGMQLPLPEGECPTPHLVKTVLWCR